MIHRPCAALIATLVVAALPSPLHAAPPPPINAGQSSAERPALIAALATLEPAPSDDPWADDRTLEGDDIAWLHTFLDDAGAREAGFELDAALRRYRQGCGLALSPAAPEVDQRAWERACEGAAQAALAVEDWAAVDEALSALLHRRPGHTFTPARFPPLLVDRVRALAAGLARGALEVRGGGEPVRLDGAVIGVAPLIRDDVPAGEHDVSCNGFTARIGIEPGATAALTCPAPRRADDALGLLDAAPAPTGWATVGDGVDGLLPGVWVLAGGEHPVGLHVGPAPAAQQLAPWASAAASARRRARVGD